MADVPPLEIKIDQDAIRDQIRDGINEALREASVKLRTAADVLDPEFLKWQDKWIEDRVNSLVKARLPRKEEK